MPDSINQVLASNLRYWMDNAELSQAALAEKAGVSQKTISNYLNPEQRDSGKTGREPSAKLAELDRIAAALSIGVWQLVRQMTDSERKMYEAIEQHYKTLRDDAAQTAEALAANRAALDRATIRPSRKPRDKAA